MGEGEGGEGESVEGCGEEGGAGIYGGVSVRDEGRERREDGGGGQCEG